MHNRIQQYLQVWHDDHPALFVTQGKRQYGSKPMGPRIGSPLTPVHRRDRVGDHRVTAFAYGRATRSRPRRFTTGQNAKVACRLPWTTGLV
jgi:hypothetical protein